jgi:hypothetical protein
MESSMNLYLKIPTLALACFGLFITGCSTDDAKTATSTGCTTQGGAVPGQADGHCSESGKAIVQEVNQASCQGSAGSGTSDAGTEDAAAPPEEEAAVLFGNEGDDDDCKYHVKWSSSPICSTEPVTFELTLTNKTTNAPVTGAQPDIDAFLSDTHVAPNSGTKVTETQPGTYTIGPVRLDAAGKWTIRFHFFETCSDAPEDSPHGHVAFYVQVP